MIEFKEKANCLAVFLIWMTVNFLKKANFNVFFVSVKIRCLQEVKSNQIKENLD